MSDKPAKLSKADRDEPGMGAWDSVYLPSMRFPQYNPSDFKWFSQKGYAELEKMLQSNIVATPLDIVRTAVLEKGWEVQPVTEDEEHEDFKASSEMAKALEYDLKNIRDEEGNPQSFRQILWEMASALLFGFSLFDIKWKLNKDGDNKGKWGFAGFYHKPCKQIGFDLDAKTLAIKNITSWVPVGGYDFNIPREKCLLYTFSPIHGLPHGNGIGRRSHPNYWCVDNYHKFEAVYLERSGAPPLVAFVPANDPEAMQACLDAMMMMNQGAPAVFPDNVRVEVMKTAVSGSSGESSYQSAYEHHGQEIAKAFQHSTLTTGEGQHGATSAGSDQHAESSDNQSNKIMNDLEEVIQLQLIYYWVCYNYGKESLNYAPKFSLGGWDDAQAAKMANTFQTYINSGVMHPDEPQIRKAAKLKPMTPDIRKQRDQEQADKQKQMASGANNQK